MLFLQDLIASFSSTTPTPDWTPAGDTHYSDFLYSRRKHCQVEAHHVPSVALPSSIAFVSIPTLKLWATSSSVFLEVWLSHVVLLQV